jgi:hypothetical protein
MGSRSERRGGKGAGGEERGWVWRWMEEKSRENREPIYIIL